MRTKLIAGNWKMNNNVSESLKLINNLNDLIKDDIKYEVLVCPSFTALYSVKQNLKNSILKLGAQNMHFDNNGAYTGEISPLMLKEIGVDFVIIGHSERRQYFNETDISINMKLKAALVNGIKPILCVGETLGQRENNKQQETVKNQLVNAFNGIDKNDVMNIAVAYEPIWAIGTGRTATSIQANEMASFIRDTIKDLYTADISQNILILYGGSVKAGNAKELMGQSDIDGALVGGASLKAEEFANIIKNAMT
jgi:triosephosphate isomerase